MSTSNIETEKRRTGMRRVLRWLSVLILVAIVAVAGIKGWRIYQKGMALYGSLTALRGMAQNPGRLDDLAAITASLTDLQGDLDAFQQESKPLLWLAPKLGWIPTYGGDLTNAPDLLELADRLVDASLLALQAGAPTLDAINSPGSSLAPADLTLLLVDAQPEILKVRQQFDLALEARGRIQTEQLSPRLQGMVGELDPLLRVMDDGLSAAVTLPAVLGADGNGPKTYLLLVQNEDELRPTGGFITTVGRLVVQDGEIVSLNFEGMDNQEDWTRPYPTAPWQMQEYMNADILVLRDSNWFANFPTSARWAEYLYSFNHPEQLDGVIAFDQQFLVMLLGALGPLEVDGAPYPITSGNVIDYMRSAKAPPADEPVPPDWYRKSFIEDIADAILRELVGGGNKDWRELAVTLMRTLDERHLLMQFDDPTLQSLLAEQDWDNAVRPFDGDFLMTTDSNIGYNKTNALVDVSLSYDVDLTDLSAPKGTLVLNHKNNSSRDVPCIHWGYRQEDDIKWYPMDRCYWNYVRVYKQTGVALVDASPHEIPAEMILLNKRVPARVDLLEEEIDGVHGFGTLLVVPGGQSLSTGFEFALPDTVISQEEGSDRFTYRLKVQKQPGRLADPLTIRIHLPNRSQVEKVNLEALIQGQDILIETDLQTDVYLEVVFHVP